MSEYRIRVVIEGEGGEAFDDMARGARDTERAVDGVNRKLDVTRDKLKKVFTGMETYGRRMMMFGGGIVAGIGALTYAGVKYNATVEQLQAKLKVFLGTDEKVREAYEWASKITLKVPLSRRDVIPIVTMLEQYGLAYENWTESVINAAAATKAPGESIQSQMETIAMAMGRIKSGQAGEGLLMLRRAGIAVENAGLKFSEAGQLMDAPQETLEKLKRYFDTQFKGAGETFGKTWEGQMLRVKSLAERALGSGTHALFDKLKDRMVIFTNFISSPAGQMKMKEWAGILGRMAEAALRMGDTLITKVLPQVMKFADWFAGLKPGFQWAIVLFPLLAGGAMFLTGKLGNLALSLKLIGGFAPAAGKGLAGVGGAAGGAAGGLATFALAAAATVAQLKLLDSAGGWLTEKLGKVFGQDWTRLGPVGAAWAFSKDFNPLAGKWGVGGVKRALTGGKGSTTAPSSSPVAAPAGSMGPLAAPAADPYACLPSNVGGDSGGGSGGGGGSSRASGVTIYQTIERLIIEGVKEIDEASLRGVLGKMATTTAGAVGG